MATPRTRRGRKSTPGSTQPEAGRMYTAKDYDRALIAPEDVFESPMGVVSTESMTPEQKLKILKHWEANARDIQVATEENMTGPGRSRLGEVRRAVNRLCETEAIDESSSAI
jgi:hypothetical protein